MEMFAICLALFVGEPPERMACNDTMLRAPRYGEAVVRYCERRTAHPTEGHDAAAFRACVEEVLRRRV